MATAKLMGASVKRREDPRFMTGKGNYVDDLKLPGMTYAAFVRSPHAHAKIGKIDTAKALKYPGVVAVFTGKDMTGVNSLPCGWDLRKDKNVPGVVQDLAMVPHMPLSSDVARHVGDPVAVVIADSQDAALDAAELVSVQWEPLPSVTVTDRAGQPGAAQIHAGAPGNIAFKWELGGGDVDAAFKSADVVLSETFTMGRHTGVTLEARAILADFDPSERRLTVYHSFQAPNMMQDILARHLNLPEQDVRVICKDVGGSFGIKVHIYPDEMATCALSVMIG